MKKGRTKQPKSPHCGGFLAYSISHNTPVSTSSLTNHYQLDYILLEYSLLCFPVSPCEYWNLQANELVFGVSYFLLLFFLLFQGTQGYFDYSSFCGCLGLAYYSTISTFNAFNNSSFLSCFRVFYLFCPLGGQDNLPIQ